MKEYLNWEWVWIKNNVKQKMSNRSKPIQGQKETNLPWNLNWVYAEWEYSKEHRRLGVGDPYKLRGHSMNYYLEGSTAFIYWKVMKKT